VAYPPPVPPRPGELSITAWLDPVLEYFARTAGIPTEQYVAQVGGEGIGFGLEMLADTFTKGWFNKVVQGLAGLIATSYAVFGRDVPVRLRRELLALGTHELLRVVKMSPAEVEEFRRSLVATVNALKRGDADALLASILKTPSEIAAALGIPMPAPTPRPAPAPAPAPVPKAEETRAEGIGVGVVPEIY
jgi:hypothetical protein